MTLHPFVEGKPSPWCRNIQPPTFEWKYSKFPSNQTKKEKTKDKKTRKVMYNYLN